MVSKEMEAMGLRVVFKAKLEDSGGAATEVYPNVGVTEWLIRIQIAYAILKMRFSGKLE